MPVYCVATHRAIQLVCRKYMFGFLPRGWNWCSNLSWTLNGFMLIFDLIYYNIFLLSLVATFSALILQGLAI